MFMSQPLQPHGTMTVSVRVVDHKVTKKSEKNIIVAGLGDGSLKIFDNQMSNVARRPKPGLSSYNEHKSWGWVVTIAFTGHAGQYELISGTVTGAQAKSTHGT